MGDYKCQMWPQAATRHVPSSAIVRRTSPALTRPSPPSWRQPGRKVVAVTPAVSRKRSLQGLGRRPTPTADESATSPRAIVDGGRTWGQRAGTWGQLPGNWGRSIRKFADQAQLECEKPPLTCGNVVGDAEFEHSSLRGDRTISAPVLRTHAHADQGMIQPTPAEGRSDLGASNRQRCSAGLGPSMRQDLGLQPLARCVRWRS